MRRRSGSAPEFAVLAGELLPVVDELSEILRADPGTPPCSITWSYPIIRTRAGMKGAAGKVAIVRRMRQETTMPLRWIALRLQMEPGRTKPASARADINSCLRVTPDFLRVRCQMFRRDPVSLPFACSAKADFSTQHSSRAGSERSSASRKGCTPRVVRACFPRRVGETTPKCPVQSASRALRSSLEMIIAIEVRS
jgi:hypothetical protein